MKTWQKVLLILLIPAVTISVVWIGMAHAAPELPASLAPAVEKAEKLDRKLVLLLTAPAWCVPCQELERKVLSTPEWKAFAANEILLETLEYRADGSFPTPAHGDLAKLPGFRGYPTLVVADHSGKLLALRDGAVAGPAELIAWIRSL